MGQRKGGREGGREGAEVEVGRKKVRERKEENCVLVLFIKVPLSLGSGTLCWHNFEHNRETRALRNNASIIADLKAELATYIYGML